MALNHCQESLVEYAHFLKSYCHFDIVTDSDYVASRCGNHLGLSTIKTFFRGQHIRPELFHFVAELLCKDNLERSELSILYGEAYLGAKCYQRFSENEEMEEYTASPVYPFLSAYAAQVCANYLEGKWEGLSEFVAPRFAGRKFKVAVVARKTRVSPKTIYRMCEGKLIRPRWFNSICRQIFPDSEDRRHARALHIETLLGRPVLTLFGSSFRTHDSTKRLGFSPVQHPRTFNWLVARVEREIRKGTFRI